MEDSCLGDACGHLDGGLPQDATGGLCVKPADAMLFEQPCNGRLTQAPRLVGRRSQGPQLQKPVRADVIGEIKQVRIIAPELVADTVAKAHTFLLQFFEQTRPLAQFDHGWIADLHQPVKMSIGAQSVGRDTGVPPIIFCSRDTEAITQAVELG